jgi:hypothetical protein
MSVRVIGAGIGAQHIGGNPDHYEWRVSYQLVGRISRRRNPPRNTNVICAILRLMSNYRRAFVPGGCWFFTVKLLERHQTLLVDRIATWREAFARLAKAMPSLSTHSSCCPIICVRLFPEDGGRR